MSASYPWRALSLSRLFLCLAVVALGASACNARRKQPSDTAQASPSAATRSKVKPQLTRRSDPPAPLEQFVQQHVEQADASGMRVLVYVGATWCEPCKRFHESLESGELDEALAGTKFIEFDADRDRAELKAAGYASKYIPLFSVPDVTGRSSGRAIEGSIKGEKAVRENLVPRLLALLEGKPTE
jgi:thiol-disulfide isomerase/thioredoxin